MATPSLDCWMKSTAGFSSHQGRPPRRPCLKPWTPEQQHTSSLDHLNTWDFAFRWGSLSKVLLFVHRQLRCDSILALLLDRHGCHPLVGLIQLKEELAYPAKHHLLGLSPNLERAGVAAQSQLRNYRQRHCACDRGLCRELACAQPGTKQLAKIRALKFNHETLEGDRGAENS